MTDTQAMMSTPPASALTIKYVNPLMKAVDFAAPRPSRLKLPITPLAG